MLSVTIEDFVTHQKALFLDIVFLQQDALEPADASIPLERQRRVFDTIYALVSCGYGFGSKEAVCEYFTGSRGCSRISAIPPSARPIISGSGKRSMRSRRLRRATSPRDHRLT